MHPCRAVASAVVLVGLVSLPATHQTDATRTPIDGPCALAIDRAGHLFIGSLYEDNVRRIDLETGKIKLVAGNGKTCCYKENAKAVNVSLDAVWALAVNSVGDLFIGETKTIRKVDTKTGQISTVGDLLRSSTTFSQIWDLAVDSDDNLFVANGKRVCERCFVRETPRPALIRVLRRTNSHAHILIGITRLARQSCSGLVGKGPNREKN
jgi:hypothetical protein